MVKALLFLGLARAGGQAPPPHSLPKEVCYINFDNETFAPVTRKDVGRFRMKIEPRGWRAALDTLRQYAKTRRPGAAGFDEKRIRLLLKDGGRSWYVDADGRFGCEDRTGKLPAPVRARLNSLVMKATGSKDFMPHSTRSPGWTKGEGFVFGKEPPPR